MEKRKQNNKRYTFLSVQENIGKVKSNIKKSAEKVGRNPEDITLVCVTKETNLEQIKQAIDLGINHIGENKVQDAIAKFQYISDKIIWHMIGHLQINKVKYAIKLFSLIHSVDSIKLAEEIDRRTKKLNKVQDVLIQVNTSGEESKYGVSYKETFSLIKETLRMKNVKVRGLMTIAPLVDNSEKARPFFKRLRELRNEINNRQNGQNVPMHLSMGMSQDYRIAVEEGATILRIGSAIFK